MERVDFEPGFESWRREARNLLKRRVPPEEVLWDTGEGEEDLFSGLASGVEELEKPLVRVPVAFFELAKTAACHRSDRQWPLLYQVLWRLAVEGERGLLQAYTDPAINELEKMAKSIRRDIHKMRAFVRFREVEKEVFVAWFEPEHRILQANAPFFRKRFGGMVWSILTPDGCLHWDRKSLTETEGVSKEMMPKDDHLEEFWRTYYQSIFNPARLKVKAMQAEMPKKYWKNLPEASLIPDLIQGSQSEVEKMMEEEERPLKQEPKNKYLKSLREKRGEGEDDPLT